MGGVLAGVEDEAGVDFRGCDTFVGTAAGSIVAARLAAGETLQEIADREFLSLHTVRVHIRDILRKTGTHRQSELVRLLHLLPSVDLERAGAATPPSRRRTRLNA